MDAVARQIKVPMSKFCVNIERTGNTSACSIPICMEEVYREGKIQPGDLVLLTAFGGGFTWGATLIRWK